MATGQIPESMLRGQVLGRGQRSCLGEPCTSAWLMEELKKWLLNRMLLDQEE